MRKVEYWIEQCIFCPYHMEPDNGGEEDSYCQNYDRYFDYDGEFPDFCKLEDEP